MGVHGLSGFLKQSGIGDIAVGSTTLSHNSSTLAIDGNGLIFHLFRLAYYRHRNHVVSSPTNEQNKELQAQLLLPTLLPIRLAHEVTTNWLSDLTTKHGVHLKIFFDGPDQYMKRHVKQSRAEQRSDQWGNVQELCMHGTLPESAASKYRSSAKKQVREHENQTNGNGGDAEAEMYLSSFPMSPLVMEQIERSIWAFEDMNAVLPCGSIQVIQCDGEADRDVAKASADDPSGMTYALACDSDYLIYGYSANKLHDGMCGEIKYLQFHQIDPSSCELCVGDGLNRHEIAMSLGLPHSSAMVDLSILLGNDYTVPFVRHSDLRKEYRESIRWCKKGEQDCGDGEHLPPESELNWYDIHAVVDLVAEKVGTGLRLTSDNEELKVAIEFSYALYSFGDVSSFLSAVPGSSDEESTEVSVEAIFPSLPSRLDLSIADKDCLSPILSYKASVGPEDKLEYIEPRHIDAFRMTLEMMSDSKKHIPVGPPKHKLRWIDMQALHVLERCLLAAIEDDISAMPHKLLDRSIFHSFLESISLEDFSFDIELVSKNEKAFVEEVTTRSVQDTKEQNSGPVVLPIDDHKEYILNAVKTQRVTIIHGETGSGKSTRVPCFLLRADPPEPTKTAPEVKMIVSQPRRIAAKALVERVRSSEPDLRERIALRMGHGMKEYETSQTRCWFVTTGYVVRLLANHPEWFDSHTHLIIDEVHERSVDTDILCLLCRRLLKNHPSIRLVLMSATMAAELYSQYFGTPEPPIHVGVRRFPINEFFVEDLSSHLLLQVKERKLANEIFADCEKAKCTSAPSQPNMEKLYKMAAHITAHIARRSTGSSILIFVPGMSDIESISELIEALNVRGVSFSCLPIHSDVPFEDQMKAFDPPKMGEVKVIIATNAAESSLTLPDVDDVICLGLCKQITYNPASHRQMLIPTWISRASATQRAGRTGRVRAGNVWRLYSKDTLNRYMQPFEQGEMLRIPLDQVILSLREMLGEAVTPILLESIEPPNLQNIERSFKSLFDANFISLPTDDGEITSLGALVVALGIDLTIGSLVGLGIQFGVAAEAIELAAILSFPKTPWAMTNPLYHDASTFNEITSKTFISRCFFDSGLLSEPAAIANLLYEYAQCKDKTKFTNKHCISGTRIRHLLGTVQSLKQRVANYLNVRPDILEVKNPPCRQHPSKLNVLRIIQLWVFRDSIVFHDTAKSKAERTSSALTIDVDGAPIEREHLLQVLHEHRHQFELRRICNINQSIRFDSLLMDDDRYFHQFEMNLTAYVLEKNVSLAYYSVQMDAYYTSQSQVKIISPLHSWNADECQGMRGAILGATLLSVEERIFQHRSGKGNQRGKRGRCCGMWEPASGASSASDGQQAVVVISCQLKSKIKSIIDKELQVGNPTYSTLYFNIARSKKKAVISAEMSGIGEKISNVDLKDMFMAPDLNTVVTKSKSRQSILFFPTNDEIQDDESPTQPLLDDAPEAARLMTVLASGRRKDHFVRFSHGLDGLEFIDIDIPRKLSIQGGKWKRHDSKAMVFVPENSPPMATIPLSGEGIELFGCCASTLDLKGGARRVEGVTLMPPGRLFTGLALLSFGFHPRTLLPVDDNDYYDVLSWIFNEETIPSLELEKEGLVAAALDFNASCINLGEVLECQPDKIRALCALFDGVAGSMVVWDGYQTPLSAANASLRSKPKLACKKDIADAPKARDGHSVDSEKDAIIPPIVSKTKHVDTALSEKKKKDKLTCQGCGETFSKLRQCKIHADRCPFVNFACVKCGDLFTSWDLCIKHRGICCPDKPGTREKAITVVSSREKNSAILLQRWACQRCSNLFLKKKECINHMRKCSGGRNNTKSTPTLVYVCRGCQGHFDTSKACQLHIKSCVEVCPERETEPQSVCTPAKANNEPPKSACTPAKAKSELPKSACTPVKVKCEPVALLPQWACIHCNQGFAKKALCMSHIIRNECSRNYSEQNLIPVLMYACPSCSVLFPTTKKCRLHIKSCAPKFVFVCHGCVARFDTSKACQLHIKSCVEVCSKKETEPTSVCTPAKAKSEPKLASVAPLTQWACFHCNQGFAKKASCMSHIIRNECSRNDSEQSRIPVLMYACPSCSILFPAAKTCRLHIKTCRSSNQGSTSFNAAPPLLETPPFSFQRWACEGCGAAFVKKKKCTNHIKSCVLCTKETQSPTLVFSCSDCNAQFTTSIECKAHKCQKSSGKETKRQTELTLTSSDAITPTSELNSRNSYQLEQPAQPNSLPNILTDESTISHDFDGTEEKEDSHASSESGCAIQ